MCLCCPGLCLLPIPKSCSTHGHPGFQVLTTCRQLHPVPIPPLQFLFGSGSSTQGRLGHWVKDRISRTISIPAFGTAIKSSPLGSITTIWAVGTRRGHCTPYLEGKIPIFLGELVDFSVHLGFFSLQVLALPEGLVQAPHQAVGKEVVKEGVHPEGR